MTPRQRAEVVRDSARKAVSFGEVRKTDNDYSTGGIYNDLTCLTVLYGVSWEAINLAAEAVYKRKGKAS